MDQYKVVIHYHSGRRKGQIITIDGIDQDNIMEILGDITQDQLANAEITIEGEQSTLSYEDFIIARSTNSLTNNARKS